MPEVASRAHLEAMVPTLQRACAAADVDLAELDGIAVTAGPGLMGALVVGLASAKALAVRPRQARSTASTTSPAMWRSTCSSTARRRSRCIALLVSGGHTWLLRVESMAASITELGSTIDDAAGEAYDKVARCSAWPTPADR